MKNFIEVRVEDYGKVTLEGQGECYDVYDDSGNYLGEIYPAEWEEWDDDDEIILSEIIYAAVEDGELDNFERYAENEDEMY